MFEVKDHCIVACILCAKSLEDVTATEMYTLQVQVTLLPTVVLEQRLCPFDKG